MMIRTLTVTLLAAFILSNEPALSSPVVFPEASIEQLQFTGRWNFDNPERPWAAWQGSTITVRVVRGAAFDIEITETAERVRVIVNGVAQGPAKLFEAGRHYLPVPADPERPGGNTVTLMKETAAGGRLILNRVIVDHESEILDPLPRPQKRVAFFGDSNPEGYSLYGEKDHGPIGTYYAYPATVARMLGAEAQIVVRGSAQLDSDGPNDVVSFIYSPNFGAEDPNYRDGFEPDVIVVNAGANDIFNVPEEQRKVVVKARYHKVVSELRHVYGDEPHILLVNAFGWALEEPANYSREVVEEVGGNVSTHLFPWCWEQWHGDMVDHAGQAEYLAQAIVDLDLGFDIKQAPEVVSGYSGTHDVINGSFEHIARDGYGSFGWRYFEDGVERVHAPNRAADGEYLIALDADERVHQCVDATGDLKPGGTVGEQQYRLTAMMRSNDDGAKASLGADYEAQAMYQREHPQSETFALTDEWQAYSTLLTAPEGTWKVFAILEAVSGTVEIDDVWLEGIDTPMRRHAFNHDGEAREYFVHLPPNDQQHKEPLPVIIAVHGYTSTATGFAKAHALNEHANANGYAVVYAQGTHFRVPQESGPPALITSWNELASNLPPVEGRPHCTEHSAQYLCPPSCSECGRCTWASCGDDLGYFDRMLDTILSEYSFDADRVYVLGVSAGAMMTYRLGCSRSERLAAVAPIIGQMPPGYDCGPTTSVPMIHLVGGLDETIRPNGTAGLDDGFMYASVEETAATWASALSCRVGPEPWASSISEVAGLVCTAYSQCDRAGAPVLSCEDPNETHNWPSQGVAGMPATCVTEEQVESLPAQARCPAAGEAANHHGMDLIWSFFQQYERADATP